MNIRSLNRWYGNPSQRRNLDCDLNLRDEHGHFLRVVVDLVPYLTPDSLHRIIVLVLVPEMGILYDHLMSESS